MDKIPEWLAGLPEGAIEIGVRALNSVQEKTGDEAQAKQAAWDAIKEKYEKGDDGEWKAIQDTSLDDVRNILSNAVNEKDKEAWLSEVYGDYLIYEKDGKRYRLSWSIMEGKVQLGDQPVEVESVWIEKRASQDNDESEDVHTIDVRLVQARDAEGTVWEVLICEPGFTLNGWYHPEDVLREGAALFEGVDVNIYELPRGAGHVPAEIFPLKSLLVNNKAGWLDNVRYVAGEGTKALLHLVDSYKWLGKNLAEGIKNGARVYGLSYDAPVRAAKAIVESRPVMKLLKFLSVDSVDIVTRPAAGGKFIRAVAARPAQNKGGYVMDKKQIWDLIHQARPDLLEGKVFEDVSDEDVAALARMAMGTPAGTDTGHDSQDVVTRAEFDLFQCGQRLEKGLAGPNPLPDHAQQRIRAMFENKVFTQEELGSAITAERDYLAGIYESRQAQDAVETAQTRGRIGVGIGTVEKAQMALDKLFGMDGDEMKGFARMETLDNQPFFSDRDPWGQEVVRSAQDYDEFEGIPSFRGIREAYEFYTGDRDVSGFMKRSALPGALRAGMDISSSTFTYALANTMARRMVKVYKEMDFKTGLLISIFKAVKDFRQQEAVLVGGFPDIATVDPEAADYDEIAAVTDEESTYTVGQKGNLLTFNRKMIINDDINVMRRLLDGFARAYARTHGKYVWAFFIDNATCSDGTAWFTSGHGNLGSAALTHTLALTAYKALSKTTEKDSGERLGLIDGTFKLNLVGPVDIMDLMARVAEEEFYYSSNDLTTKLPNPLRRRVVAHEIPLLTDADDWGLLLPSDQIEMIEMGYLNGRQEPEYFVADSPQGEQVFVADKIRHKGRHEYAGAVIDYRSGYKAQV